MKKIVLLVAFIATAMVSAQTAYVDTEYLIANIPDTKVAESELQAFTEELKKQLTADELVANNQFKKLQEQAKDETLSKEDRVALATKAQDLEKGLQRGQKLAELQLSTERNKIMQPIYDKINAAIAKVAKEKGYKLVVSITTVMYAEENLDITKAVQAELGF